MVKRLILFISVLSLGQTLFSQQDVDKINNKTVNWGIRGGFNALSSTHYNVWQNDTEINDKSVTNKVGFVGSLFMRINLNNFFMQPEFSYYLLKEDFSFKIPVDIDGSGNTIPTNIRMKTHSNSLNVPVLIGYNIVKDGPYLFNAFVGPSLKYNYRTHYFMPNTDFYDKTPSYNINFITGFSVNISHLYFDCRFELNRPNLDTDFHKISDAPEYLKDIHIKKNGNILNFSFGLMF